MTTNLYDPATALASYYPDRNAVRPARLWTREKTLHDWADMGAVEFFEGNGTNPTSLDGYAIDKLWLQVASGVTEAPGTIRYYAGGDPTLEASWPELDRAGLLAHLGIRGGGFDYAWTSTTSGNPGTGAVGVNNATLASATQLRISKTGRNGQAYGTLLAAWISGDRIVIFDNDEESSRIDVTLASAPTDAGAYFTFTVTVNAATSLADRQAVNLDYAPLGAAAASAAAAASSAAASAVSAATAGAAQASVELLASNASLSAGAAAAASAAAALILANASPSYRVPVAKTQSDVARLADAFTVCEISSSAMDVILIPPSAELSQPLGAILELVQTGPNAVAFAAGRGVTIKSAANGDSASTDGRRWSKIRAYQSALDFWIASGDLNPDPETFDYYVDKVAGSDSNNGLSANAPKQTLAAVSALLANNKKVGIARSDDAAVEYLESIDQASLTGVTIGAYGKGRYRPRINCADPLTGWVSGAQPNVYKKTGVALTGSGTVWTNILENKTLLQRTANEAACSALAGSYYITADSGTVDIYVHASDGGNPASNGKTYEYSSRLYAIHLGATATVTGIEGTANRHNDGSIVLGDKSTFKFNRVTNGGKHNYFVGFGSIVRFNEIEEAHKTDEVPAMGVFYSGGAVAGTPDTYHEFNFYRSVGRYAAPGECFLAHNSSPGTNSGTNFYSRWNTFEDCFGGIGGSVSAIAGDQYFEHNWIQFTQRTTPYRQLTGGFIIAARYVRYNKFHFAQPYWDPSTNVSGARLFAVYLGNTEISYNEFEVGPYFLTAIFCQFDTTGITLIGNRGHIEGTFLWMQGSTNIVANCTGNAIACAEVLRNYNGLTVSGTWDNNHWLGAVGFTVGGVGKTWAQWQALGYDAAADANADISAAALSRTGALNGRISDVPQCLLYVDAQETASITQSGGFVSAVADLSRGGRNLVLHQPTPGTDKVSLTTQGGKPYFAPVAAGGLKLASQDFSVQIRAMAAVVRLNATLSASATLQTLLSFASDDSNCLRLGPNGAYGFPGAVLHAMQGGGTGWSYVSAATYAANTPHLVILAYDAMTDTLSLRIDGTAIGTLTKVGSPWVGVNSGNKAAPLFLMRGQAAANSLGGYLGMLALWSSYSHDAVATIEANIRSRWGI